MTIYSSALTIDKYFLVFYAEQSISIDRQHWLVWPLFFDHSNIFSVYVYRALVRSIQAAPFLSYQGTGGDQTLPPG